MTKNLKPYKGSPGRAFSGFWGSLGALAALCGFLAAPPALWGQGGVDDLGEDFINDIFMEAAEGMDTEAPPPPQTPPAPPETPPVPPVPQTQAPPQEPPVPEAAPVRDKKMAGKPPRPLQSPAPPIEPVPAPPEPTQAPPEPVPAPPEPVPAPPEPVPAPPEPVPAPPEPAQAPPEPVPAPAPAPPAAPKKVGKPPIPLLSDPQDLPAATLEPEGAAPPPFEDDLFLGPDELMAESSARKAPSPINLGALPSLPWETTDPNAPPGHFISNAPKPQFDSSESNWKQLDVGQSDVETAPPPSAPGRTSAAPEEASPPPQGPDRAHLRSLFSDMMPPPSQGTRPPSQAQTTAPSPEKGTPGGEAAPPPANRTAKTGGKPPVRPADRPHPPAADGGEPAEDAGGSAILQAGGQLTMAEQFGLAAILPPLTENSDLEIWQEAQKLAEEEQKAALEERKADPPPAGDSKTDGQKTKTASARPTPQSGGPKAGAEAAAPRVRSRLSLVNETGNPQLLEAYRSVLSQMGYTIVSTETRASAAAPTGHTIISYRPGLKARANAVARHLPGRKTLMESAGLPTEIAIFLR